MVFKLVEQVARMSAATSGTAIERAWPMRSFARKEQSRPPDIPTLASDAVGLIRPSFSATQMSANVYGLVRSERHMRKPHNLDQGR
jgi:hypothetical protein